MSICGFFTRSHREDQVLVLQRSSTETFISAFTNTAAPPPTLLERLAEYNLNPGIDVFISLTLSNHVSVRQMISDLWLLSRSFSSSSLLSDKDLQFV